MCPAQCLLFTIQSGKLVLDRNYPQWMMLIVSEPERKANGGGGQYTAPTGSVQRFAQLVASKTTDGDFFPQCGRPLLDQFADLDLVVLDERLLE